MSALSAVAGAASFYGANKARTKDKLPSYEATFSVPLKCDTCVNDIKSALSKIDGTLLFPPSPYQTDDRKTQETPNN